MATPKVQVEFKVTGNKYVSDEYYSEELTVVGKTEKEYYNITTLDGYLSIGLGKIGNITHIQANSTNAKIKVTDTLSGVTILPISGKLFWKVPTTFSSTIADISVGTDSTTNVSAEVSIWGE